MNVETLIATARPMLDWEAVHLRLMIAIGPRADRRALAAGSGLSKSTIDNILAGRSEPAFTKVACIADHLDLSLNWLAFGLGTPGRDTPSDFKAHTALPVARTAHPPKNHTYPHGQPAQPVSARNLAAAPAANLLRRIAARIGNALISFGTGVAG